jgi:hypothetical protein
MPLKSISLLVVALLLDTNSMRAAPSAPAVTPNVVDEAGTVVADASWAQGLLANLDAFERQTHVKVLVQYHAKSPPDAEDVHPGDYMRALSTKLGSIKKGILMVHFADDPDWRVWIGDDLTPKFVGKPGTAKDFTESGAMHEAKEAVLAAAMKRAADAFARTKQPVPDVKDPANPNWPLLVRLQTDALIDGLRAKFTAP